MRNFYFIPSVLVFLAGLCLCAASYSQSCPSLPGGFYSGSFGSTSHEYLFPGIVPAGAPSGAVGSKTIGHILFGNRNVSFGQRRAVTIVPTLDGTNQGKVLINILKLSFNANTSVSIYQGSTETGTLVDEINTANASSKAGAEYIIDGPATLVFWGSTPNVANNNMIRFVTGDVQFQTCNQNRTGLIWKDFITPNTYVVVDDQESETENLSTSSYNFLPACIAYFDQNKNFVRVESAFCLDQDKEAPSPGYWYYPGQYNYALTSTTDFDVDRNGFDANIDNLKIARILWLIQQAEGQPTDVKGDIQIGIWRTQLNALDATFTAGSWASLAQAAVPGIPSPPEPAFNMNFPVGESGKNVLTGTIQVEIPFSWSSPQAGQTNTVKLDLPSNITVQSVTGGTISGTNLTITASVATLTLASTTTGQFEIKAIYDSPLYYNVSNLQVYTPCDKSPESQAFLHIGEENIANPFRSISVEWTNPLPVRLVAFDAAKENSAINLRWRTTDETNFSHFEVEKSLNAKVWVTIGLIGQNETGNYEFVDQQAPAARVVYYRLKMVDQDQTYAYSSIRTLENLTNSSKTFVYPNPVVGTLNVGSAPGASVTQVHIFNQSGTLVLSSDHITSSGIDVRHLDNGVYTVKSVMRDGTFSGERFVIRK